MAQCIRCGQKATVAVTRAMSIFPTSKRFYCDDCKAKLDRKEDIILVLTLTATFMVVVVIILFHYLNIRYFHKPPETVEDTTSLDIQSPDSLQNILTPAAWATYQRYGYPFDRVSTEDALGTTILYKIEPQNWKVLYERKAVRDMINFPDLMDSFLKTIEDANSGAKLRLVFLTEDRELGFTLQFGTDENPSYIALLEQLQNEEYKTLTGPPQVRIDKNRSIIPAELPTPTPEATPESTPEPEPATTP